MKTYGDVLAILQPGESYVATTVRRVVCVWVLRANPRVLLHKSTGCPKVQDRALQERTHDMVGFPLIRRSHSISFTRAQSIHKYKIGLGGEKDWRVGEGLVDGGGGGY